jgi:hypothetical protein
MRRRHWIAGLVAAALVVAAFLGVAVFFRSPLATVFDPAANAKRENRPQFGPDESRPIGQTHIGKSRTELIAELGEPTREGPWPIGNPPQAELENYNGFRTLEWHWASGHFFASIYPVDGQWICFNSYWVPNGVVID